MKMTNKFGYSKLNYELLKRDDYKKAPGTLSVSDFGTGMRELILKERNPEREVDVSARIQIMIGQALHAERRKVEYFEVLHGFRVTTEVEGVKITGEFDSLDSTENFPSRLKPRVKEVNLLDYEHYIDDLKVTKVWNVRESVNAREWQIQLTLYKFLLDSPEKYSVAPVGVISAYMKDYAARDKKTFDSALEEIPFLLDYSHDKVLSSIVTPFVREYVDCGTMTDDELPLCVDRWRNDSKCKNFCSVRNICDYGLRYQDKGLFY